MYLLRWNCMFLETSKKQDIVTEVGVEKGLLKDSIGTNRMEWGEN